MNRTVVVTAFAVASLTLLVVQVVSRFGYDTPKGVLILGVIAVLALFTTGVNSLAAMVVALALFYALDYVIADRFTTAVLLAALAVVASLAVEGRRAWRR